MNNEAWNQMVAAHDAYLAEKRVTWELPGIDSGDVEEGHYWSTACVYTVHECLHRLADLRAVAGERRDVSATIWLRMDLFQERRRRGGR